LLRIRQIPKQLVGVDDLLAKPGDEFVGVDDDPGGEPGDEFVDVHGDVLERDEQIGAIA
jgi:hypothetical protein